MVYDGYRLYMIYDTICRGEKQGRQIIILLLQMGVKSYTLTKWAL